MAQTARPVSTDAWQSTGAEHRLSGTADAITESVRNVLLPAGDHMILSMTIAPNSDDDRLRAERQDLEGTRAIHRTAAFPTVLPSAPAPQPAERFILLQKLEGTVLASSAREFTAVLREKDEPDQEATFDIEEVPEGDRSLIAPGAVFHWSIGYRDRRGQRTRESIIRFRRLPEWTSREFQRAEQEVDEFVAALHWGRSKAPR